MIRVTLLSVGKTREPWLKEALSEYEKRLTGKVSIEYLLFKTDAELALALEADTILLDPQGKEYGSEEFALFFAKCGSRISFAIGGPEGFSEEVKRGRVLLSLSRLTFTHQLARLILVEQIYRAYSLLNGSPYHK